MRRKAGDAARTRDRQAAAASEDEADESDATEEEATRERTTRVGRPRGGMRVAARIGEYAFLCKGYLYSLHHILSGPSIFSRIFSNIENILTSRRSTETKSRSKPAQNLQNLKISVGIDPKPTVEGGNSCFELSRQDRFRRRTAATSRIVKNIFGLEVY